MTTDTTPGAQNAVNAWQGIESAPKDGTRIRLGHERDTSSMKQDGIFPVRGWWDGTRWVMAAFFIIPGGQHGLMSNEPTHWQPLPPQEPRQ